MKPEDETKEKAEDTSEEKPEANPEEEKKEEDEFNIKGFPKIVIVGLGHVFP